MKQVSDLIREHSLFQGMAEDDIAFIAGCAQLRRFNSGDYLARESEPADHFYLLLKGRVVIEAHHSHQRPTPLLTLGSQDVVGWSWLFPPYMCYFDARCLEPVRSIELDGRCLRDKCDADPRLGYDMMKRISQVMIQRLRAANLQLLDLYGEACAGAGTAPDRHTL